jgi:TatD DNase family protein
MLVDSHCHLDYFVEAEIEEILARARGAGVGRLVTIGTRYHQAAQVKALAERFPDVYGTVGIHPHNAGEGELPSVAELVALADHPRIIGIGETGLDYFTTRPRARRRRRTSAATSAPARATGLPLAIHARQADEDIIGILREERAAGGPFDFLLHCFSSGRALAEQAVEIGGYLSFSGILTFPKSPEIREVARDMPADRLLVETDSPYLAPCRCAASAASRPMSATRPRCWRRCARHLPGRGGGADHRQLLPPLPEGPRNDAEGHAARHRRFGRRALAGRCRWQRRLGRLRPAEPRNRRTRTSCVVEGESGQRLLIDAGPDLRQQLLANRISQVHALVFTHAHADHVMGIDDLRQVNRNIGATLDAYGTKMTLLKTEDRFDYAFRRPRRRCSSARRWNPAGGVRPGLRSRRTAGEGVPSGSRRDGQPGRAGRQLRLFDRCRTDPEESMPALEGLDTWVVGCFQHAPHKVHANLAQVLAWVERLKPRRTVLTHMGPAMDYQSLCRMLPPGIEPGHDGMVLEDP